MQPRITSATDAFGDHRTFVSRPVVLLHADMASLHRTEPSVATQHKERTCTASSIVFATAIAAGASVIAWGRRVIYGDFVCMARLLLFPLTTRTVGDLPQGHRWTRRFKTCAVLAGGSPARAHTLVGILGKKYGMEAKELYEYRVQGCKK